MILNAVEFKTLLAQEQFQIYFVPQVNLHTYKITGVEAKMFYIGDRGVKVEPQWLIPVTEKTELTAELELLMLRKICQIQRERIDKNQFILPVTATFSIKTAAIPFYIYDISLLLKEYNLPNGTMILSIESAEDWTCTYGLNKSLQYLKNQGWSIGLPDIGTAVASLEFLSDKVVDTIKINQLIPPNTEISSRKQIIIDGIMNLTKQLDIETTCDGIDAEYRLELLQKNGCTIGQGRIFGTEYIYEDFIGLFERNKGYLQPENYNN